MAAAMRIPAQDWGAVGQSIGYHAAVSSDGIESGLLKRSGDVFVGRFCEVTSHYFAWKVHVTQDLLEGGRSLIKK